MSRRLIAAALLIAALVAPALPAGADTPSANGHGLTVVATNVIDSRQAEYTVSTAALKKPVRIPRHFDNYVFGTHTFPYWAQDFREYLPMLMDRFAHPSPPTTITYASTAKAYNQWDWGVAVHRTTAERLTTLRDASKYERRYEGSDPATIVTPPWFTPGRWRNFTVASSGGYKHHQVIVPPSGRLTIPVPGNANVWINEDDSQSHDRRELTCG